MFYSALFLLLIIYLFTEASGARHKWRGVVLSVVLVSGLLICFSEYRGIKMASTEKVEAEGMKSGGDIVVSDFEPLPKNIKMDAYVDNASPAVGSTINLIVFAPEGSRVTVIFHFKEGDRPKIFEIKKERQAVVPVVVDTSARGYIVVVDVIVYYNGKSYRKNTMFTPK